MIGPDGQFLACEHTRSHYRERWYPEVFERGDHKQWMDNGGTSLSERAVARVEQILAEHTPQPLPDDTARRVNDVVRRAEKRFGV